jgi:hypothetical protein
MYLFFIILFFIAAATSPVLAVLSWCPGFCIDFLFVFGTTKSYYFFLPSHTNANKNIFFLSFDGYLFFLEDGRSWKEDDILGRPGFHGRSIRPFSPSYLGGKQLG